MSFYGELLSKYANNFSSYGNLVFSTDPVNLNKKLLTKSKAFQVGLQKFENAKLLFYPDASIKLLSNKTRLIYNWILYKNVKYKVYRFKPKYKLLHFANL